MKITPGNQYLIVDETSDKVCCIFKSLAEKNKGLVVWRVHPHQCANYQNSNKITKIWLTNVDTAAIHLRPKELEQLCYDIEKFMNENKGSAVLLSSIEYLISFNSFAEILHLIQNLRDIAADNSITFIVYVGKKTLSVQEEELLKQELIFVGDKYED
jgi:hypothetical protein